jgi:hypothetical protein
MRPDRWPHVLARIFSAAQTSGPSALDPSRMIRICARSLWAGERQQRPHRTAVQLPSVGDAFPNTHANCSTHHHSITHTHAPPSLWRCGMMDALSEALLAPLGGGGSVTAPPRGISRSPGGAPVPAGADRRSPVRSDGQAAHPGAKDMHRDCRARGSRGGHPTPPPRSSGADPALAPRRNRPALRLHRPPRRLAHRPVTHVDPGVGPAGQQWAVIASAASSSKNRPHMDWHRHPAGPCRGDARSRWIHRRSHVRLAGRCGSPKVEVSPAGPVGVRTDAPGRC